MKRKIGPRKQQRSRLPRNCHINTTPVQLLGTNTLRSNRTIQRKSARRLADQLQRRRARLGDIRTHAPRLRFRNRKCCGEGSGRGSGEVGDGRVDAVGRDGVEGGTGGEGRRGRGDGGEGGDAEHGVLEGEVVAGGEEA